MAHSCMLRMSYTHAGNHERDWPGTGTRFDFPPARDSGGECGVPYDKRFPMPLPGKDREWCAPEAWHRHAHLVECYSVLPAYMHAAASSHKKSARACMQPFILSCHYISNTSAIWAGSAWAGRAAACCTSG